MKTIKKLLPLTFLFFLLAMIGGQPALARTPFQERVDTDNDGICDDDFFLGPYSFCAPNDDGKPDNCPDVANLDQADADGDGVGDACDTPDDGGDDDGTGDGNSDGGGNPNPNDGGNPNPNEGTDPIDPDAGGCSLAAHAKAETAVPFISMFILFMVPALGVGLWREWFCQN